MIHRVSVELESVEGNEIKLPKNITYILQSFVYELGRKGKLHERFFEKDSKYYHLFVFSPLIGKHTYKNNFHVFHGPVRLIFSSPVEEFCTAVAQRALESEHLHLGSNEVRVVSIMPLKDPNFSTEMTFKALSPVTVHKTIDVGKKKRTLYLEANTEEFERLVKMNLVRKFEALHSKISQAEIDISPLSVKNEIRMYEKDKSAPFVIKGWSGTYALKGDLEIIKFAYWSGIGARNSQGFGFLETA